MAGGPSDYDRGTMEIDAQSGTFSGFMGGTKYGGAAVVLTVLMPTLIFAVGMSWFAALIATVIVGFIIGAMLKLKGGWYVGVVGVSILVGLLCAILSLVA